MPVSTYRLFVLAVGLTLLAPAASRLALAREATPSVQGSAADGEKSEEKVYALVEDAIAKAQSLKLPENRIQFQTMAACLLWSRDEGRARALIRESMTALAALVNTADRGDPRHVAQMQFYTILRFEIVRRIAARDAKLALEFLRATRQDRSAGRYAQSTQPDPEQALELVLAVQIADSDTGEAARIAEESLRAGGAVAGLLDVLRKLGATDRAGAAKLAAAIIRRLLTSELASDGEAAFVATSLLVMTRGAGEAPRAAASDSPPAPPTVAVEEQARRDLTNAIVASLLKLPSGRPGAAHQLFNSLPSIMTEVERYAPNQLAAVRLKAAAFGRALDPSAAAWQRYEGLRQKGSADALIEAAGSAPPEIGDELYAEAALKVLDGDDPERARQIINNISDPQRRAARSRSLEQQLLARTLRQGKPEEVAQSLPSDAPLEDRVSALLNLSSRAARRKETAAARRFLSEAWSLVSGRVQNGFQFSSQLLVARAYSAIEPRQSFVILDDLAEQLNDLLAAAATVDGFGPDCFGEGELKPFVGNMWGELVKQFGEELARLAPQDVERALSIAQKFQKDEVRVFVSLRLAERILSGTESQKTPRALVGVQ